MEYIVGIGFFLFVVIILMLVLNKLAHFKLIYNIHDILEKAIDKIEPTHKESRFHKKKTTYFSHKRPE
jgi:hypothetical protein